jgi:hypothetical protein
MFDTGYDPAGQKKWADMGVTMFEIDADVGICRKIWAANAQALAHRKVAPGGRFRKPRGGVKPRKR